MIELSCYYSLSSPWAYFGGPRLQDIVRRHRVKLVLKPYDFQDVVPRTGGVPLRTRPEPRRTYHAQELDRWRQYLGMPLNLMPKHYPQDGKPAGWNKPAGWTVIAAQERGLDAPLLSHALLRALWAEERDTSDPSVRKAIADENGLPGAELVAAESGPQVQALYQAYGEEAERLGVFGAPTYVLNGVRYWGQDRLDFVDRALERLRAGSSPG
jgi:2-hydroxychromene-2-carboxylate isomerase